MILIAIPKSASTSMLLTLGKLHNIKAVQDVSFRENKIPENCNVLFNFHSDVREFTPNQINKYNQNTAIYKQHIFPSPNNLNLLKDIKKVILLRPSLDIVLAYRRGALQKVHNLLSGYNVDMTEKEWIQKSETNGLFSDLNFFINQWKSNSKEANTIFIHYKDFLKDPKSVINKIELFYNLPITKKEINPVKARYSRRNSLNNFFYNSIRDVKKELKKIYFKLKYLLNLFSFKF